MAQPSLEPRYPGFLKARQGAGAGRKARTRSHLGDWVHCGIKLLACKLHANRCKTACFMLICRVESYDIFGNRAAALVPGHCRTRVPFFFLSFIIMIGPINLGLAVILPLLACKPGSCHPQGLPLQSPGPAWAHAWSEVSSQLSGYTCPRWALAGRLRLPHMVSLHPAGCPGLSQAPGFREQERASVAT